MPDAEGMALHRLARTATRSGLGPIVEIGTYCGRSAVYLGSGAADVVGGPAVAVFTVDHHHGSEEMQVGWEHHDPALLDPTTGRMDSLGPARRIVEEAGLEGTVVLVVGESAAVAAAWRTPLSLLFVDGGHGHDVAWADYRGWAPNVAVGGLLALHDVYPDPADGGRPPYEIFSAARAEGWTEEPELGCGSLRVLRRTPSA